LTWIRKHWDTGYICGAEKNIKDTVSRHNLSMYLANASVTSR